MKANTLIFTLVLSLGLAACGQEQQAESPASDSAAPAVPQAVEPAAPAEAVARNCRREVVVGIGDPP